MTKGHFFSPLSHFSNLPALQSLPENPHFGTLGGSLPSVDGHFSLNSQVNKLVCEKSIRRNA
jgi:hypothetical protein